MWGSVAALALGAAFALGAYRARLLTGPGALVAGALGASIVGIGGAAWGLPPVLFFGSAAALSRLPRPPARPPQEPPATRAEGDRNAWQVLANGGVAWALLLAAPVARAAFPQGAALCYWGFAGAFAAAAADTWATEVGTRCGGAPRSLRTLQPVDAGVSGAVSGGGTLAALAGAAVVAAGTWPAAHRFLPAEASVAGAVLLVTGAGVAGALVDSVAGAFLQARYRDPHSGQRVEGAAARAPGVRHEGGLVRLTNDGVNAACTAAGAVAAMGAAALWL